jgi:hypothetical protein
MYRLLLLHPRRSLRYFAVKPKLLLVPRVGSVNQPPPVVKPVPARTTVAAAFSVGAELVVVVQQLHLNDPVVCAKGQGRSYPVAFPVVRRGTA